ncbi:hybrid sensor histidine kinase/response regulator [Cohnella lupini]|uniref:histidine kinase n=1 Tax=Cohnella lupini TaxID=1294267 RepID=A0A3D9IFM3_9BACL|nr:ATP-binding protein [Cohnella lupini]RED60349.1 histidine kinase/DNA gyrase B/HSP90-like ATPase [Cohnella lupini]
MRNKTRIIVVTSAFLILLIAVRILWILVNSPSDHPNVARGELDLRGWKLSSAHSFKLDGEWQFYPNTLLEGGDIGMTASDAHPEFIRVPGNWKSKLPSQSKSPIGIGTYRLRILIDPDEELQYGIRLFNVPSSSALYVNGERLASSGNPARSAEGYVARNAPYSAIFHPEGEVIDLVVQVSNFDDVRSGGIVKSISFGTDAAINRETWLAIGLQLMVCAIFILHAVYAFILYFIGVRQRVLMYFAGAIGFSTLWVLVSDDMLLSLWFPLNYEWFSRIQLVSFLGASVFMLEFTKRLLTEYLNVKVFRWYSIVGAIFALYVTLAPVQYVLPVSGGVTGFVLLSFLIVPVITLRTAMKSDKDAIALLLGASALANNMVWSFAKDAGLIEIFYYPVDLVVSFLAFVSYWFKRYIHTFAQSEKMSIELRKADKQKDDFLANTSHELRNPLHGMLNMTQIVLDSDKQSLNGKSVQNLELILTVGRRMSFMLNDLIDLTRLKEENIKLQARSIQIQNVIVGVIDMLRSMLEGKPVRLVNRIPDDFPPVMAEENRLIQILYNLLHNAMKFTDEGNITIRADVKNRIAYISIEDTGIGMDTETQRAIFEPYAQGDSGMTAAHGGGIGLGLSISKQLVELHGGKLESSSSPGKGSVFTFTLPIPETVVRETPVDAPLSSVAHAETAAAFFSDVSIANTAQVTVAAKERPAILIVDDDALNLRILESILDEYSFDVVAVTSGKEALSRLESKEWDLVITDIMMPRMSGYELTRAIRERYSLSELPILHLTARNRTEDIAAGFQSGANDYIAKPADAIELRTRVKALTDLNRSVNERLSMEAAWLQAQIKPHFLFNSLNAIAALSEIDLAQMRQLLNEFSNYLRSSFDFKNAESLVLLERELDFVRSYLYIEKERFENRLLVEWEINADLSLMIPPLSIQPLVENALRHGILSRTAGGRITIGILDREDRVEVVVTDNGKGMEEETLNRLLHKRSDDKQGIGLLNVDRRLKQIYGQGLQIRSQPDRGTTVSFFVKK